MLSIGTIRSSSLPRSPQTCRIGTGEVSSSLYSSGITVLTSPTSSRPVSTQSMTTADNLSLLNEQRAKRPSSPWHIYQPQLTSMSSIANRATGAGLSVGESYFSLPTFTRSRLNLIGLYFAIFSLYSISGFYGIFLAHLAGVDSATMLDTFASLPGWFQMSTKALIAGPAAYHTINGFRHLGWDTGYCTFFAPLVSLPQKECES